MIARTAGPQYQPAGRMVILEVRAARGWTLKQTGDAFLVAPATIAAWMDRIDEPGSEALVQLRSPVNKFPDFVRYAVQELKTHCPLLGKKKAAEVLARAGLHLGATTIERMRKEAPGRQPPPKPATPGRPGPNNTGRSGKTGQRCGLAGNDRSRRQTESRVVTAKRPTTFGMSISTRGACNAIGNRGVREVAVGMLPQCWPFCWWVAVVMESSLTCASWGPPFISSCPMPSPFALSWEPPCGLPGVPPKYLDQLTKGCQFWPCCGL